MSGREEVAFRIAAILQEMQQLAESGERLAASSGGLVNSKYFLAARVAISMAVGDLDSKGLLPGASELIKP